MEILRHLVNLLVATASDRNRLAIENAVLRQQILVLQRDVKRVRLEDTDRMFWIFLRRFVRGWRDLLFIVQPETVIRWHRRGFRYYWRKRSQGKPGRPPLSRDLVALIRRLSIENPALGSPAHPVRTGIARSSDRRDDGGGVHGPQAPRGHAKLADLPPESHERSRGL